MTWFLLNGVLGCQDLLAGFISASMCCLGALDLLINVCVVSFCLILQHAKVVCQSDIVLAVLKEHCFYWEADPLACGRKMQIF